LAPLRGWTESFAAGSLCFRRSRPVGRREYDEIMTSLLTDGFYRLAVDLIAGISDIA